MIAQKGNKVKVHYTGKFKTGEVFDSSVERQEPLEFEIGAGQMIPGFDQAVEGMEVKTSKQIVVPAADAYGPYMEENKVSIERDKIPADIEPKVGMQLMVHDKDGNQIPVLVEDVSENAVMLDGNHPMAGKDLIFDIDLLEIN